jgi:hypothetical protein
LAFCWPTIGSCWYRLVVVGLIGILEKQSKEDSVKTTEVRAEESILRVGTAKLLVWRRWGLLERVSGKIAYWYSTNNDGAGLRLWRALARCRALWSITWTANVERVLANVDADEGDRMLGCVCHSGLLVFGAPRKHRLLVAQEHGRTIPLADLSGIARSGPVI